MAPIKETEEDDEQESSSDDHTAKRTRGDKSKVSFNI